MLSVGKPGLRAVTKVLAAWAPLLWAAAFTGCAASAPVASAPVPEPVIYEAPLHAPPQVPDVAAHGSLWQADGRMLSLYATPRAGRVGDIVTVRIVESSSASNSATTTTGRSSSISGGIEKFFDLEDYIAPYTQVAGSLESDFEGDGSTDRSGKLKATITVRVVDVLPNGDLRIAGSREMAVNNERQFITLTGFVRPEDIDQTNTVLSTYISDARITYSGSGVVNDRQRPGWMMRTLDVIWPF
jgi:flagellar L-ring protein precursor FlgH